MLKVSNAEVFNNGEKEHVYVIDFNNWYTLLYIQSWHGNVPFSLQNMMDNIVIIFYDHPQPDIFISVNIEIKQVGN